MVDSYFNIQLLLLNKKRRKEHQFEKKDLFLFYLNGRIVCIRHLLAL